MMSRLIGNQWSAPVGVSTEHARVGLCRQVADFVAVVLDGEDVRLVEMGPGQRPHTMRAEEPLLRPTFG